MRSLLATVLGGLLILVVVGGAVAGITGLHSVDEGHESVLKDKGDSEQALTPGTYYWHNPVTHSYKTIDMRPQLLEMTAGSDGYSPINVKTDDQLEVPVDVAVTYNVTDSVAFHEEWRDHERARNILIRNPARDVVYTVGGNMTTEEITTDEGRERMKQAIRDRLNDRFSGEPVELLTVELRDVRPPQQYMQERQNIKNEEQRVEQANRRAQQRIEEAEGEAEANRIVQESLSESLLTYRQIEALENASAVYIPTGDGGLPTYVDATANATATGSDSQGSRANATAAGGS